MTSPGHVVVVGAGLAGLRTIEDLRGRGYAGQVTLVGAERRLPYDRPPLSKKLLTGALDDTTLRRDLDSLHAEVRLAERAVTLADGVLATDAGEHAFDALVLATGATPVTLPWSCASSCGPARRSPSSARAGSGPSSRPPPRSSAAR
jgi:3-phenylpropionate/trans-cinnamate dioxygenase ferredoxin reductase component